MMMGIGLQLSISGIVRWTILTERKKRPVWRWGSARGSYRSKHSHHWETNACQTALAALRMLLARNLFRKSRT